MSYQALALLPPHSSCSLDDVARSLEQRFTAVVSSHGEPRLIATTHTIILAWSDWSLRVTLADAPHVLLESQEMADLFAAGRSDRELIARCQRRIEVAADSDPQMDHFNDYIFVLDVLERIPHVILFDPSAGTFYEAV